jgi:hypothetical protein
MVTLWLVLRDTAIALFQYASVGAVFCFAYQLWKRLFNYCIACRKK